jgi:hypothetical protein
MSSTAILSQGVGYGMFSLVALHPCLLKLTSCPLLLRRSGVVCGIGIFFSALMVCPSPTLLHIFSQPVAPSLVSSLRLPHRPSPPHILSSFVPLFFQVVITKAQTRYTAYNPNSEEFSTASRSVKPGLIAVVRRSLSSFLVRFSHSLLANTTLGMIG